MEFKGTKGKWEIRKGTFGFQKNCTFILSDELDICLLYKVNSPDEEEYNAQLISKVPEFYQDVLNDLDLFDEILDQLPLSLQNISNALKKRKKEKEKLIKEATEL